ncbi:DUF2520 domain-containing protein [Rhodobacteraceae bacterium KMM 6894]|nr:DUF2520 domain-containing protein [Rhodobacteraceae bacterium KMM 6894]
MTLNLVGAGNVGQTLCHLLLQAGVCEVQDITNRTPQRAIDAVQFIGSGRAVASVQDMRPADIWLITVSDTAIASVAADLAACGHPPAIAVHCSGFLPASEMAPLGANGWHLASTHPIASFADPSVSITQFRDTYCGLEGDEAAVTALDPLLSEIGARCFPVRSDAKAIYHAAAVFSNNLTTVLQALAQEAWAEAGVPDEATHALQATLLKSTVENTLALGPQAALTGPAARGDSDVVTRQHAAVAAWHPEAGRAYDTLSTMATRLKRTGKTR